MKLFGLLRLRPTSFELPGTALVPQVSQPAVSPISQPAGGCHGVRLRFSNDSRDCQPATQPSRSGELKVAMGFRSWSLALSSIILYSLAFSLLSVRVLAFPPAPDGIIYGMVKDQFGTPLTVSGDQVILQTPGGVQVVGTIQPGLAVGINYELNVPMDAGTFGGPYNASALLAGAQYKLYVVVGSSTNLPMEMTGAYSVLGIPAALTRQDLTIGSDSNGDGIPDSWETLFLSEVGANVTLAQINPNADYAHDGRTLKQEYLLGDYPYDPGYNFSVQILSQTGGSALLAFTAMTGRTYSVNGSSDLKNWTPVAFAIPANGPVTMTSFYSSQVQPLQFQTIQPTNGPILQFFQFELQ